MVIEAQRIIGYSCLQQENGLPSREYIIFDIPHSCGSLAQAHLVRKNALSFLKPIGAYCQSCHERFEPDLSFLLRHKLNQQYQETSTKIIRQRAQLLCLQGISGGASLDDVNDFYITHAKILTDPQVVQQAYQDYINNPRSLNPHVFSGKAIFEEEEFCELTAKDQALKTASLLLYKLEQKPRSWQEEIKNQLLAEVLSLEEELKLTWQSWKKNVLGLDILTQ